MPPVYRLDASACEVARALRAEVAGDVWPGGEVVPGGYAPVVITNREQGRHLVPRQWGVPPPPRGEHAVPFVRNLDSPFWIGVLRHTQFRCLVPITGLRRGDGWWVPSSDSGSGGRGAGAIRACAGIWRDSEIPSFAILTTGAARGMPVILPPEAWGVWLSADIRLARKLVEEPL